MGMIEQKEWALIMRAGPNSVITEEVTLYAMNPKKAAFHVKDALLFKRKKDAEDWARTHGLNWCFQPEKINDRRT